MIIKFDRKELAAALKLVAPFAAAKSLRQCLACVAFDLKAWTISATDLECAISAPLKYLDFDDANKLDYFAVNAATLNTIVGGDNGDDVKLMVYDKICEVCANSGTYKLPLMLDQLPAIAAWDHGVCVFGQDYFARAAKLCDFAQPGSGNIYALNGIYISGTGDGAFDCAASDGNRLAVLSANTGTHAEFQALVIAPGMRRLAQVAAQLGDAQVNFTGSEMLAHWDNGTNATARLLEGKFPNYRKLLADAGITKKVTVKKSDAVRGLRILCGITDDNSRNVNFNVDFGRLQLTLQKTLRGEGFVEIPAMQSAEIKTAFNVKLLLDAVQSVSGEDVTMGFAADNKPLLIVDGDYKHMLTPCACEEEEAK